jgi:hypothetical protein
MRRLCATGIAIAVACGGVSCSLITSLDDPTSNEAGSAEASSGDQNAASDASPIILASLGDDAGIVGLYVDSQTNDLFFTATNLGNVYEIAAGTTTPAPVITQLARPDRITGSFAANGSSVVYVAAFGPSPTGAGIFRRFDDGGVNAAVGTGSFVASGSTFPLHPYGIAVLASTQPTIYWTNCNDPSPLPSCTTANSQIIETDLNKGLSTVRTTITSDFARDIVTTDDLVLWDTAAATLYAQSLDGGAAQVLEPTCAGVIYFAPPPAGNGVSARIYFTSAASCGSSNTIEYRDLSNLSTAKQTFATDKVNGVFSMTSDGTYLYWANHGDDTIVRQLVTGTASPEVVVTSPAAAGPPKQMVVSRGVLYWTTDSSVVSFTLPP